MWEYNEGHLYWPAPQARKGQKETALKCDPTVNSWHFYLTQLVHEHVYPACPVCFVFCTLYNPVLQKFVLWRLHQLATHSAYTVLINSCLSQPVLQVTSSEPTNNTLRPSWIVALYITEVLITKGWGPQQAGHAVCRVPAYAWHCTHHLWAMLKTPVPWGSDHHCSPEERTKGCEVGPRRIKVIPGTRCPPHKVTGLPLNLTATTLAPSPPCLLPWLLFLQPELSTPIILCDAQQIPREASEPTVDLEKLVCTCSAQTRKE